MQFELLQYSMDKASSLAAHLLSSSGSSFLSSSSSSFSKVTAYEEVLESFLQFLQSSPGINEDFVAIQTDATTLIARIEQALNNESTEINTFAILQRVHQILKPLTGQNKGVQPKTGNIDENETCSTVEKQGISEIVRCVSRIVYGLFTGQNNQKYAQTVLSLQENAQKIFMELIEKQMGRSGKEDRVEDPDHGESLSLQKNCSQLTQASIHRRSPSQTLQKSPSSSPKPQDSGSPAQLVTKLLNLEQYCQLLQQQVHKWSTQASKLQAQNIRLLQLNKQQSQDKDLLHAKIGELTAEIERLLAERDREIGKVEKKWEGRLKIVQKNKQEQIAELVEVNQATLKRSQIKIQQFQDRLNKKRQKIQTLYETSQQLQTSLQAQQANTHLHKQHIANLTDQLTKAREQIHQLQLLKDSLSLQIDARNNRLEDMRVLLFANTSRINVGRDGGSLMENCEEGNGGGGLDWSVGTGEWKDSTHASKFRKLNFNGNQQHWVSQMSPGSGYSWFKQSFTSGNGKKAAADLAVLSNADYNRHYSIHVSYLNQKIQTLTQQNESLRKSLKKVNDLKYENKKLCQSLKEHQCYRGEENEIMLGCLYELRKMHQNNVMEIRSLGSVPEHSNVNTNTNTDFMGSSQQKIAPLGLGGTSRASFTILKHYKQ